MNYKIFGYILAGLGILGVFVSTPKVLVGIPLLNAIPSKFILIPAIVAVGVGIVLMMGTSENKFKHKTGMGEEVPIFKGKEINLVSFQARKIQGSNGTERNQMEVTIHLKRKGHIKYSLQECLRTLLGKIK